MTDAEIRLLFLNELDDLLAGCEKQIIIDDDPSGLYTEYVLDTEKFREKIQQRMQYLRDVMKATETDGPWNE